MRGDDAEHTRFHVESPIASHLPTNFMVQMPRPGENQIAKVGLNRLEMLANDVQATRRRGRFVGALAERSIKVGVSLVRCAPT